MKFTLKVFLGLLTVAIAGHASDAGSPLLHVGFDSTETGPYVDDHVRADWPSVQSIGLYGRSDIVQDEDEERGKVLRIAYPKGAVGPREGGGQFVVSLPPSRELWLSYLVKFEPGFNFRLGGKLPGLTSGGGTFTGGVHPSKGEGWSARFMWREEGRAVVYLYYVDKPGKWGEDLPLGGFTFRAGKWHRITEHIRVNSPDKADGILEGWIDGAKLLSRSDIRFRIGEQDLIDSLYFSTFHGGNTAEWGPEVDSVAFYDEFIVSDSPLEP